MNRFRFKTHQRLFFMRLRQLPSRALPQLLQAVLRRGYFPPGRRVELVELPGPMELLVTPEVFNPRWGATTEVLLRVLEGLDLTGCGRGLDLGTGTGAAAIHLARRGLSVDAVDINPYAVQCARINVQLARVDAKVTVRQGDLFSPVPHGAYDIITFNPPFLDGRPGNWLSHAFLGGPSGELIDAFLLGAPDHLKPNGRVVLTFSSMGRRARLDAQIARSALEPIATFSERLGAENITHHVLAVRQAAMAP